MSGLENERVICISSVDWDPIWTRKQQVMSRLPESNTVLYVEPPITLLSPFKDRSAWHKWAAWRKGLRRLNANIYLYSPPVILPFANKFRFINKINQWWMALFLKRNINRLGFKDYLLWTYMPNTADLLSRLPHRKLMIYDCVDEHSEYTGIINRETMLQMERDLLRACDLVFVTAQGLYESKKKDARRIYFLPNAANVQHFMKAQHPDLPVPDDISKIPGPIVGFVGVIQDWIDLDLVKEAAQALPSFSFVMIGPVGPGIDVSGLEALPNVTFLGRRDVSVLPNYIKAFAVCINPFKNNELTSKVSPLKFYEYLASGKPIVSVRMPGVAEFAEVIEITDTPSGFTAGIQRAVNEDTPAKTAARLELARQNTWESRVDFMMEKIKEVLL